MGGDNAPGAIVEGAVQAARDFPDKLEPILVGDEGAIRLELTRVGANDLNLKIVHTEQTIGMSEGGADAFRKKRDSSMALATRMVKEGTADGAFTAGNTGAMVAASLLNMGRIPGVHRPALATPIPTSGDPAWAIILDVGATADCKPAHLYQFAILGDIYYRKLFNVDRPKVGLLNIGEESSKGNELTQGAFELLQNSDLNFIGNVEGKDVLGGTVNVVVTDGFTGNVMLKFAESVWAWTVALVHHEVGEHLLAKLGALLLRPSLRRLKQRMDYSEYGGAPLLGLNGISFVGHGRSNAKAVHNALRLAADLAQSGINDDIKALIAAERQKGGELAQSS